MLRLLCVCLSAVEVAHSRDLIAIEGPVQREQRVGEATAATAACLAVMMVGRDRGNNNDDENDDEPAYPSLPLPMPVFAVKSLRYYAIIY
jgi:hypothetical protein